MMLQLGNVRAGYGRVEVLHGIDLVLEPGRILGLLGRNGAGKTTTIRAVMGLVDGLRGSIRIGGTELVGTDPHRIPGHGIAWVPQGRRLFPEMSVGENLRLGLLAGRGGGAARDWSAVRGGSIGRGRNAGRDRGAGRSGSAGRDGEVGRGGEGGRSGEVGRGGEGGRSGEVGRGGEGGRSGEVGSGGEGGRSGEVGSGEEAGRSGGAGRSEETGYSEDAAGRLAFVLDLFPALKERLDTPARRLSGGQQQMVAMARALAAGPRVLLLDEPTEGLQPSYVDRILETVAALRATGTAMLLVEQKVEAALAVVDRIAFIENGRIREHATAESLARDPEPLIRYVGVRRDGCARTEMGPDHWTGR